MLLSVLLCIALYFTDLFSAFRQCCTNSGALNALTDLIVMYLEARKTQPFLGADRLQVPHLLEKI